MSDDGNRVQIRQKRKKKIRLKKQTERLFFFSFPFQPPEITNNRITKKRTKSRIDPLRTRTIATVATYH